MKNVTPAAGQVWGRRMADTDMTSNEIKIGRVSQSRIHGVGLDGWINRNIFIEDWLFIPQSDLEWLAVNVNGVDVRSFYAKDTSSRDGYKVNGEDLIRNYGGKLVQSKQIELGLDEPQQKDTKMIDLRTAKIGDEYINTGSSIVTMVMMSDNEHQFVGKVGQSLSLYNKEGKNHDDSCNDLVSKHDPRHWLKDLPDADIFDGEWLACETFDCEWYLYQGEPMLAGDGTHFGTNGMFALGLLSGIKMPKLKGDEWKLSKISIPDLKAWQEQNK